MSTTIPQKPGMPVQQGHHKSGPPSAEQLRQMRETDNAAEKQPVEETPPDAAKPAPEPPTHRNPATLRDARSNGVAEQNKTDYKPQDESRQAGQLPREPMGHKINLPPQTGRVPGQPQRQGDGPGRLPPEPREMSRSAQPRPLPPEPTQRQVRSLLKDPMFQGHLKGSPLHQKLLQRALEQNPSERQAAERRGERETLTRGEIGQLFSLRHKLENKKEGRALLRHDTAKEREDKRQKVQALRYQNERSGEQRTAHKTQTAQQAHATEASDAYRERLAEKLSASASESAFEQVLQEVLKGGRESVPDLPQSVRARFAAKTNSEWEEFFVNALKLSSSEIESQGQLDKLIEALYRGLYRRGADGKLMLVSDLSFTENGEIAEHKYSRLPLGDEELVQLLEKFKPGDVIGEDLLRRLGEEFMFIRLAHVVAETAITEEQKKSILREFRQQVSSSSQRGLENELARRRKPREESEIPNPMSAHAGDQFNKKERYLGPPKFLLYMIYAVIAIGTLMILTILGRQIF